MPDDTRKVISMRTYAADGMVKVEIGEHVNELGFTPAQALTWAKLLWNEAYTAQKQLKDAGQKVEELGEQPVWGKQALESKEN